jgi:hypothetical protein
MLGCALSGLSALSAATASGRRTEYARDGRMSADITYTKDGLPETVRDA